MTTDPSGLAFADPTNPQSLNLYSYVLNNPLNNIDPTGLDCVYVNNDTGAIQGFNRGDCDNSSEDKANTGQYIDGTVNTIFSSDGTWTGKYGGYDATRDNGSFFFGRNANSSGDSTQATVASVSQPDDNPNAMDIFRLVGRETRPVIASYDCFFGSAATGVGAYVGLPGNPNISPGTVLRTARSTARNAVAMGGAQRAANLVASAAKPFGAELAEAAATAAGKTIGKAVPAIAVAQGVYASSKAYDYFTSCYASY